MGHDPGMLYIYIVVEYSPGCTISHAMPYHSHCMCNASGGGACYGA